jgi:hypothetical protein
VSNTIVVVVVVSSIIIVLFYFLLWWGKRWRLWLQEWRIVISINKLLAQKRVRAKGPGVQTVRAISPGVQTLFTCMKIFTVAKALEVILSGFESSPSSISQSTLQIYSEA